MGKNKASLKLTGFNELITKLDGLGGNVKKIAQDALEQAGETIGWDTLDAMAAPNLPAGGKYSTGTTEKAVVTEPKAEVSGNILEIGVGFDYTKEGVGGILITGTPRMRPDYELNKIFKGNRYMNRIKRDMEEVVADAIEREMEK